MGTIIEIGAFIENIAKTKNWCKSGERLVYRVDKTSMLISLTSLRLYNPHKEESIKYRIQLIDWLMEIITYELENKQILINERFGLIFMFTEKKDRQHRYLESPNQDKEKERLENKQIAWEKELDDYIGKLQSLIKKK